MNVQEYIIEMGGSTTLLEKVQSSLDLAKEISKEDAKEIFINQKKIGEKNEADSLFIFTDNYIMESKDILSSQQNIDLVYYKEMISYMSISTGHFNYKKSATQMSRINVYVEIENLNLELNAFSYNCDRLWKIIINLLRPNFFTGLFEDDESS